MAGSFQSVSIQSIRSPSRQRFPGSGWTARHSLVTPGHSGPIRTAVSWLWMDWPAVLSSSQEFFQSHRVLQRPLNKRRKNNPAWERSRGSKAQSSFGPESSAMSEASGHRSGGRVRLLPPAQRTGGIKKEDIKTGTYRNDMFPLMSIFFFLPRLFNGLCGRGV